jgi:hypothetical protein
MAEKKVKPLPLGGGAPRNSKPIFSREGVKKLSQMGYDPIEEMINLHDQLDLYIHELRSAPKPSVIAITQALNTKQKIIADLLRYGYTRTLEKDDEALGKVGPINITLTTENTPKERQVKDTS